MRRSRRHVHGFAVVELLVLIAVLGMLMALVFPAIQRTREAARGAQCANNLRQLAIGALDHHEAHGRFPTGGWGWNWTGDPDLGYTKRQPGGWVYNILPYLEQSALHDIAIGLEEEPKRRGNAERISTPLSVLYCPSRREPRAYPAAGKGLGFDEQGRYMPYNAVPVARVGRSDYAANAGDQRQPWSIPGPESIEEGLKPDMKWPDMKEATGISFLRSEVCVEQVGDGLSYTYLLGEKYVDRRAYETGTDPGDRLSAYCGYSADLYRSTYYDEQSGKGWTPMNDKPGVADQYRFGGPHPGVCNMAFCDGSIRAIRVSIDPKVHRCLGNRRDGQLIDQTDL